MVKVFKIRLASRSFEQRNKERVLTIRAGNLSSGASVRSCESIKLLN